MGRGRGRPNPVPARKKKKKKLAEEGRKGHPSQGQAWVRVARGWGTRPARRWLGMKRREYSMCCPLQPSAPSGSKRPLEPRPSALTPGPLMQVWATPWNWQDRHTARICGGHCSCPLASFWFLRGERLSLSPDPRSPRSHTPSCGKFFPVLAFFLQISVSLVLPCPAVYDVV